MSSFKFHRKSRDSLDTGKTWHISGAKLLNQGLPVVISEKPGFAIMIYQKTKAGVLSEPGSLPRMAGRLAPPAVGAERLPWVIVQKIINPSGVASPSLRDLT